MPSIKTSSGKIYYKTHILYYGVKYIDKAKALDNLILLKSILDKNHINFELIYGTLLGVVREHDFISHDEDIDLALLEEDKQKTFDILPQLIKEGFEIARYDRRNLMSIIRNGEYIDLYFFKKGQEKIRTCSGLLIPEKFLMNTSEIEFKGHKFLAPSDFEGFLMFEYGTNWRTPIEWHDFQMPRIERWKFAFKEHLKDILPQCLFNLLVKRAEKDLTADYQKRVDRYLENGGVL